MADILLNVEGMKVYYPVKGDFGKGREFVKAVDGVSFEVRKGEVFGIVGESGCGKSTLGRGICKLETPTAGKIVLSGEDISSYGRKQMRSVRKKVQMVFQDPYASLNPRMSVFDIIAEPLIIHSLTKSKKELEDRVMELLRKVGLDDYHANRYPHEFSGGQRQFHGNRTGPCPTIIDDILFFYRKLAQYDGTHLAFGHRYPAAQKAFLRDSRDRKPVVPVID